MKVLANKQTMKSNYKEMKWLDVYGIKNGSNIVDGYGPFNISDTPLILNESGERYLLVKRLSERKVNPRNLLFSVEPGMYDVKIGIPNNEVQDLMTDPIAKHLEKITSSK